VSNIVDIVITLIDLLVQLMICSICWTMGSNIKFRGFQLKIVRNTMGSTLSLHFSNVDSDEEMSVYVETISEIGSSSTSVNSTIEHSQSILEVRR
jgi:hypothetical protein